MNPVIPHLVLASRSPRRAELLRQLGLSFDVAVAAVEERRHPGQTPAQYAVSTARAKAQAVAQTTDAVVLGADTDVVIDDEILGQPKNREDALAMLARLSNREHEVYSGVAVVQGARCETALSVTRVRFGVIPAEDAAAYWRSGEPADKAGAYAIQGGAARWVRELHGSYSGVVGLPLYETGELLSRFGVGPLAPLTAAGSVPNALRASQKNREVSAQSA